MSSGSYFPPAVKGVEIPKKSGGKRLLGIPTVGDRVAQMVVKIYFEPQVEPYFHRDSYGYRPGKSALDAIAIICRWTRSGNGLQLHRIDKSKDPNFWSARVNRDVRLVVHKTGDSLFVAYVGHHDDAYAWAERRRIEAHPRTGAVQIVEVRERVEEFAPPAMLDFVVPEAAKAWEGDGSAGVVFLVG